MSLPCFHAAALRLMICIFIVMLPDLTNPVTYKCLFVMIVIKVLSLNVGYFSKPHICTERGKRQHCNRDPFVPRDMKSWNYMVGIPAFLRKGLLSCERFKCEEIKMPDWIICAQFHTATSKYWTYFKKQ